MSVLATAPFATAITVAGFLASAAYVAYRFGPALLRLSGWCSFWAAWVTGGQGGYGYCAAFLLLGLLAWGGGTVWFARRRGRWPSAVSRRVLTRVPGFRSLALAERMPAVAALRRHPWR